MGISADGELLTRKQMIKQGLREAQEKRSENKSEEEEEDGNGFMDSKASQKVLELARLQRDELEAKSKPQHNNTNRNNNTLKATFHENNNDSDDEFNYDVDEIDEEEEEEQLVEIDEMGNVMGNGEISAEEEAMLAAFMDGGVQERRTLADIIMEKIQEK